MNVAGLFAVWIVIASDILADLSDVAGAYTESGVQQALCTQRSSSSLYTAAVEYLLIRVLKCSSPSVKGMGYYNDVINQSSIVNCQLRTGGVALLATTWLALNATDGVTLIATVVWH